MAINFACPKCSKKYAVKDELAGKAAKCAKCGNRIKVPEPVAVDLSKDNDLSSWFDEELSQPTTSRTATPSSSQPRRPGQKYCQSCKNPLEEGAVLCVNCGLDLRSGKKLATEKVVDKPESRSKKAVRQTASLGRGAVFSAIGAALGASIWVAVAIFTGYELGWIAWGLGFAAGAGMAMGHEDNDGTTAGLIAAGMSILGILGSKFAIFEYYKAQHSEFLALTEALGGTISLAVMFGPIDILFIIFAVGSAYKVGSGRMTD